MIERDYWQHAGTGEIWAVETENGRPVKCAGPLNGRDADPVLLPYLRYARTYLAELLADWRSYSPYRVCSLCNLALLRGATTVAHNGDLPAHLSCSLNPPKIGGSSVGAAVLAEGLWQTSARLVRQSAALRATSRELTRRCAALRIKNAWGAAAGALSS